MVDDRTAVHEKSGEVFLFCILIFSISVEINIFKPRFFLKNKEKVRCKNKNVKKVFL